MQTPAVLRQKPREMFRQTRGAAEAGAGVGEEHEENSNEVEVEGGSGAGVPVIKPAPVYNKQGGVVEVTQDIVDAVWVSSRRPLALRKRARATSPTCTLSGCMWSTPTGWRC